ncbi:MAG TPA: hypothetical protein VD948_11485 [Rhodothermales bacterium]|nr:hypothetical protein [Rhodothermales bacterium]
MLPFSASAVLLLLAGAFCLLATAALWRALEGARQLRYGAVAWFDAHRWPLLAWPALIGLGLGVLLSQAALPLSVRLGIAALVGMGLVLLMASFVLQTRIVVSTEGVRTSHTRIRWTEVDDYVDTAGGLTLFHRNARGGRTRLTVPVPRRHRARVSQITSACLDARFEYAARVYAGRQAQEG